jgi:hypothetical protein
MPSHRIILLACQIRIPGTGIHMLKWGVLDPNYTLIGKIDVILAVLSIQTKRKLQARWSIHHVIPGSDASKHFPGEAIW